MSKALPLALVLLLGAVLAWMLVGWEPSPDEPDSHRMLELARPPTGGDFTLMSAEGPVSLADFRGRLVLLFFGYTWCPDICPINLSYIARALDDLTPQERRRIQVLFVSVDPDRDTPRRLTEYTGYFAPEILGLTGSPQALSETAALYGAAYRRVDDSGSAMGYLIDHSADTYLIDPSGRLQMSLDHATPPERIAGAIREQLRLAAH